MVGGGWMDVVEEKRRGREAEQSFEGDEVLRKTLERRRAFLPDVQSFRVKSGLRDGKSPVPGRCLFQLPRWEGADVQHVRRQCHHVRCLAVLNCSSPRGIQQGRTKYDGRMNKWDCYLLLTATAVCPSS